MSYTRECIGCGKIFQANRSNVTYCSGACQQSTNNANAIKCDRSYSTKKCIVCGKEYRIRRFNQKFCSPVCRVAWEATVYCRKETRKTVIGAVGKFHKVCPVCKNGFSTNISNKIYCSDVCRESSVSIDAARRFTIMARDGFRCRYCGATPWEEDVKLEVDHINPNGDNNPMNLITACSTCNGGKKDRIMLTNEGIIPTYQMLYRYDFMQCKWEVTDGYTS